MSAWLVALFGCAGGDESGVIALGDANNYTFDGESTIGQIAIAPQSDLHYDWSGVTRDLQCHDLDPTTVTKAALAQFQNLSLGAVTQKINSVSLQQADLTNYVDFDNVDAGTEAMLSEFTYFGTPVDASACVTVGGGACMAFVQTGDEIGVDVRSMIFLVPTEGETNVEVPLPDPCGSLEWSVELEAMASVSALAEGPWVVDWSGLTVDGRGDILDVADIDQLMVAHYTGETLASLEERFLDLELISDAQWTMPVANVTQADLSGLTGTEAFGGFTADGVWLLSLRCTSCPNPAPLFLGAVQVE